MPRRFESFNSPFITVSATVWTLIRPADAERVWISVVNQGGQDCTVFPGEAAGAAKLTGIPIKANGGYVIFDKNMPWPGAIYAIADGAILTVVCVSEVLERK